jgi:hypothetical protein
LRLLKPIYEVYSVVSNYVIYVIIIATGHQDPMQNVDMVGCRRRRAYALQGTLGRRVDFRCIRQNIPCTVRIGDTANFTATFNTGASIR